MVAEDICNKSLSHLAVAVEIQNLENDKGNHAQAFRRFYADTVDEVERDYRWPFTTTFLSLAQLATNPNPNEWAFAYRRPSDCLMERRIVSGVRTDTPDTRVPYRIGQDAQGELIFTDQAAAVLEYTARITNPDRFPKDFVSALSLLLAFYAAPRVTAGDPFGLGKRAGDAYLLWLSKARANATNEEQPDFPPDSEMIRARG